MARLESIAVGGYFPTPLRVIPYIAALIDVPETKRTVWDNGNGFAFVDPCAGDGEAVLSFAQYLFGSLNRSVVDFSIYAAEMEESRFVALKSRCNDALSYGAYSKGLAHGDAFRVVWEYEYSRKGASCLWLNPPYDIDREMGRLEERFLRRFTQSLAMGGILVFIIPVAALAASAATLAKEYTSIHCFRFPSPEYEAYKQVVVLAKRSVPLLESDPETYFKIHCWADKPDTIPVLPGSDRGIANPVAALLDDPRAHQVLSLPALKSHEVGFSSWEIASVDFYGLLAKARPWHTTDRSGKLSPIPNVIPHSPAEDLLIRRYPLAMPPRSAHIASGIAAGIFNGFKVHADNPASELSPLLVKGVFDREYRTIDKKVNKDGEKIGEVQVQQPKLVTTVLDLSTYSYVTIRPKADKTGTREIAKMTMADLLDNYGRSLMDVMLKQCPVLHDPGREEDAIDLAPMARTLFKAQSHATQAAVKLLGGLDATEAERRGKSVFVLGEIGSGKTTLALAVAKTIKAKKVLVMCPPHLLDGWVDQIRAVLPEAQAVVLSNVGDIQALMADKSDTMTIAIMSRETAKLGHAWGAVEKHCPKCGSPVPEDEDLAKTRARCASYPIETDGLGRVSCDLALTLIKRFPESQRLRQLLWTRQLRRWPAIIKKRGVAPDAWDKILASGILTKTIDRLIPHIEEMAAVEAIECLLLANPDPELIVKYAEKLYAATLHDTSSWGHWNMVRNRIVGFALLLRDEETRTRLVESLWQKSPTRTSSYSSYYSGPKDYPTQIEAKYLALYEDGDMGHYDLWGYVSKSSDGISWDKVPIAPEASLSAVAHIMSIASFWKGAECGEPLFEARPDPRRFPLAQYICKKHPDFFKLLVLDEGHEYATDGSAQERAAHRLTSLGIPTMLLTGTIMNGYAESLYTNLWYLSPAFRQEFSRDERQKFIDRYGYRKRIVEDRDDDGKVIAFGTVTDRVERRERIIGNAPGVLPLLLLKHLLPLAVTLHKADLAVDIPPCVETVEGIEPEDKLFAEYNALQKALIEQLREDKYDEEKSGALLGALAQLPAYFDLATNDTGNQEDGSYEIRYPESLGGGLVIRAESFPASTILPKERWMLETIESELKEDRNVLVFGWHTVLLPRLARLIEENLGIKAPILNPDKVSTRKRQKWIDKEVVGRKRRVLITNPVCVQTGLNNLVYFASSIWMQNPTCNPVIKRQADGRIDRIGQMSNTRIYFPIYAGTTQQYLHSLLMHKVAVSMSTDGLDAEAALQAAGVVENDGFTAFSVGRQLYEMIISGREMPMLTKTKKLMSAPIETKAPLIVTENDLFEFAMSLG